MDNTELWGTQWWHRLGGQIDSLKIAEETKRMSIDTQISAADFWQLTFLAVLHRYGDVDIACKEASNAMRKRHEALRVVREDYPEDNT